MQIDNGVIEALMVEGRLGGVRSIESTLKCERLCDLAVTVQPTNKDK